jgi:acyl dehydratase
MPIDPDEAVGAERGPTTIEWDERDVLLYQLSLGGGWDPLDARELRYVLEPDLTVLPTFALVAGNRWDGATDGGLNSLPGIDGIDLRSVLHGEQEIELHRPIPSRGSARSTTTVADVWDKGKAAVLRLQTAVVAPDGSPLWTATSSIFVRGEGGFGGDRGPSGGRPAPERAPDSELVSPTSPQQALLYRLNGDRNPLHADPEFAAAAGFERPILHGLCTYGIVCRAVVDAHLDGDVEAVSSFAGRFRGVVLPGETLVTRVWDEGGDLIVQASTKDRGEPVLTDAVVRRR